jgi:2-iminobutanoate/2-iminopropanoate deaminase
LDKQLVSTENALKPIHPYYSQAVKVAGFKSLVFVSGQTWDPKLGGSAATNVVEQTEYIIHEIQAILEKAGTSLENIVKLTVFVKRIEDLEKIAPLRNRYFASSLPASSLVEIKALWHPDVLIEIECVAAI